MSVGSTLRKLRERNGMTQEQFADKIGVKRTTYISYETSKTSPAFSLVERIAEIFDISILNFTSREEEVRLSKLNSINEVYRVGVPRKPVVPTSEEEFIIEYYRSLDDEEKDDFIEKIRKEYLNRRC